MSRSNVLKIMYNIRVSSTLQSLLEMLTEAKIADLVVALGILLTFSNGYGTVTIELKNGAVYRILYDGDIRGQGQGAGS